MKKVHINMCPILDGYGVMGVFQFPYTPSCEPCLQLAGCRYLDTGLVLKERGEGEVGRYSPGGSQPIGRLFCGRRWHFRKSALSTDKFKLKVISRS